MRRGSPVEGLLVLLDLAARQLVELRVDVHELVLLLHLLAFLEFVVDPLSPAEQVAELGVRWHDVILAGARCGLFKSRRSPVFDLSGESGG